LGEPPQKKYLHTLQYAGIFLRRRAIRSSPIFRAFDKLRQRKNGASAAIPLAASRLKVVF
jgi:hypothetical protein